MINRIFFILLTSIIFYSQEYFSQTAALQPTLELKEVNGLLIPYQNNMPLPGFEKQNRTVVDLHGTWKKNRFEPNVDLTLSERDESTYNALVTEAAFRHTVSFDDSGWEDKEIPSVENTMYEFPTVPEYYQKGVWYRCKFSVNDSLQGKFTKLIFLAVNYIADVWLNDQYLGYHEGGYTPFAFDVSDKLNYSSENLLAVRVDNIRWGSRKDIVPFYQVDWFNYAGIIHDVYIEFANDVSTIRADIVPLDTGGGIEIMITIKNAGNAAKNTTAEISVYETQITEENLASEYAGDLIGNPAAISGEVQHSFEISADGIYAWKSSINISDPKLWFPADPNLYVMKVTLREDQTVVDEYFTQFGIRKINTDGTKVKLNDKVVFLTGAARHEDHPVYGRSLPKEIIFNDLKTIFESNINLLRTAHYPNHPYTYLITDRLGIAVMEEIPVWWFDNEQEWLIQNNERHIHEQMFREMVFKDFNRPSIILWSTSNECKEETNRIIYNERIVNDLRTNYNDGRLISQSSAGDRPGPTDITQSVLDVAGWTLYFGIFHGGTYYGGTASFLAQAHNAFPNLPILDTEFGYWSSENGSSTQTQVTVFKETFKAFEFFSTISASGSYKQSGFLMGVTWWCVFDWYSHGHPNGYQSMGLISMDRSIKKPVYDELVSAYAPYYNVGGVVTGIDDADENILPDEYKLNQNYPNPFNPETNIEFDLPFDSNVHLIVYNILGEKVVDLVDSIKSAGRHKIKFNEMHLTSGVYICQLTASEVNGQNYFNDSIKMMYLK